MTDVQTPPPPTATDLQDERLRGGSGFRGALSSTMDRLRGGDLGLVPVLGGLAVIWAVLQTLNPIFLSSRNLSNLLLECASVGVIALGVVCVLLVGQIDLSVGSISGLSAAVLAVLSSARVAQCGSPCSPLCCWEPPSAGFTHRRSTGSASRASW